jgi:hypothetical protein
MRKESGVFICGICERRPSFSSAVSTVNPRIVVSCTLATGTPIAFWSGWSGGNGAATRSRVAHATLFPPPQPRQRRSLPAVHREVARWLRHQAVLWWVTTDRFIEHFSHRIYQSRIRALHETSATVYGIRGYTSVMGKRLRRSISLDAHRR